jgi:catechol 2,3-dioxygenase-like lactoylglutathione lyase family enzyme
MNILATTVTLTVNDPALSASFLVKHFGFREALSFDGGAAIEHPDGGLTLFLLRVGLDALEASLRDERARSVILAFTVKDIDAEVARLKAYGVELNSEVRQD